MSPIRRFVSYYKPYKSIFFFDLFCAIVLSVIDLAFPQILSFLTKDLFLRGQAAIFRALLPMGIGLVVMYIIRSLCQFYVTSYGHFMGARMESDMRRDLFDRYTRLSFSYYDKNNTGEMMSRLVSDLFDISELAHHGPEDLLISAFKIIGSFAILMSINVKMTLILLAVTAAMVVFSITRQKTMQRVYMDNRKKIAVVNADVQDSLSGIRVVQTFANEHVEREKFKKSNISFLLSKENSYWFMGIFHGGNKFFQGMLYVAILVSGAYFAATGGIEAADLAIYALYIGIFLSPIEILLNFTETFQKAYAGFVRFCEIIETEPDVQDCKKPVELENVCGDIEYENVSFSYDEGSEILSGIDISIPAGKTVALVGPSGGGKTTICSLLPRFYDVLEGRITIDGRDIREYSLQSLRKAIGIVQQDVYMFAGSIKSNIAYGRPESTDEEIIEAAKNAGIHDFVMSLPDGYDSYVGERGTRLSGGQKQRLAIARVFLKNPPIIILDEATSALDNESERYIQASLERLSKNRTSIVIAHRLSTIIGADEIIVIGEDGIRERGSHDELLKQGGTYARYYRMQFETIESLDAMLSEG